MSDSKPVYDFVYLTNTPSFYKLNLCEAIARQGYKFMIVLYGYGSEAVNQQLNGKDKKWSFDFRFINEGDAHQRNKFKTFLNLLRLMRSIDARRVLFAGWMSPEYNLYSFLSPKSKNTVVSESTWWDISMSGLTGFVKRKIIGRMSAALPSGKPHSKFFRRIGFKGQIEETGSVGILAKPARVLREKDTSGTLRYICVARLIDCKNLRFLIRQFNQNGLPLTIVGKGPLENELKALAGPNIEFAGFVNNDEIGKVYQSHDIFILPSTYEQWGLVVEEALYWGLPVIVSDRVGASIDMVKNLGTGVIFDLSEPGSFEKAIADVSANYQNYRKAVIDIDWDQREKDQVEAYIKLLK